MEATLAGIAGVDVIVRVEGTVAGVVVDIVDLTEVCEEATLTVVLMANVVVGLV